MRSRLSRLPTRATLFVFSLLVPGAGLAQEEGSSPWNVGIQSSWPAYGLSARYDVSDRTQLQGVLGALGTVTNVGARINRDFKTEEKYDIYGFGTVGIWRYGSSTVDGLDVNETSVGLGGGAGVEFDLAEVFAPDEDDDFPALFWSLELGLTFADFENYEWSAFGLGGGLHYHF